MVITPTCPVGPVGPAVPDAPEKPAVPVGPISPVWVAPVGPVGPVADAPVYPVEPVAPVTVEVPLTVVNIDRIYGDDKDVTDKSRAGAEGTRKDDVVLAVTNGRNRDMKKR